MTEQTSKTMNREKLTTLFSQLKQLHIVVVGDLILDKYMQGDVERISPEAPVPIVVIGHRESRLGGAANVALNCKSLEAYVALASVIGDDEDGITLIDAAKNAGIETELILRSERRITTNKTRIISRNQHMLRLDEERCDELNDEDEHLFTDKLIRYLSVKKPDVVILEDYNKGVLKETVIERIISCCNENGIITTVDPKLKNFFTYKNVTLFKPNLKEVSEALHMPVYADAHLLDSVHGILKKELHHDISFITLSDKGVYCNDGSSRIIPSHLRNIADVSGAGDTVIATASLIYALTKDAMLMAEISNIAGGLVCEESGVVPINKEKLSQECMKLLVNEEVGVF